MQENIESAIPDDSEGIAESIKFIEAEIERLENKERTGQDEESLRLYKEKLSELNRERPN